MKTAYLTGAELDYWVYLAIHKVPASHASKERFNAWRLQNNDREDYSSNWAHGGPIIDHKNIRLDRKDGQRFAWLTGDWNLTYSAKGETALIAAMRACVISEFGIEVPDIGQ